MSKSVQRFDLVVVGAGMVGSLFVLRLLQSPLAQGLRIAVIEGQQTVAPQGDYALRVSSLSLASEALINQVGCGDALRALRHCRFTDMQVWDADGTGSVHFRAKEAGESHLGSLYENDSIQAVLSQALWRQPQVTAFCPDRLSDVQRLLQGWRVQTASGALLETPLLVAADGALSRTRELAGIQCTQWDYQQQGLVATVRTELPHANTAWQRFLSTGPLAFLPLDDSHYCSIVWTLPSTQAQHFMSCTDDEFNTELMQAFERKLGTAGVVGKRAAFPLVARHAEHYVLPGLALIGDAAHSIHPLAGQGVNLGFLDAAALADRLIQGLSKGLLMHDDFNLRRYSRDRRGHNELFMHSMTGMEWLFASDSPFWRMARNQGMRWFNQSGPIKQQVMAAALGKLSESSRH
jgi:2-octaprenylphenol hydroxylase